MEPEGKDIGRQRLIDLKGLQALFDALSRRGYRVIGPRLGDGAIIYDDIASIDDLPAGWTDRQEAGEYRWSGARMERSSAMR